jgi:hypothetical protein
MSCNLGCMRHYCGHTLSRPLKPLAKDAVDNGINCRATGH